MAQRFESGAFVQQCFAVHPLCLSLKRIDGDGWLVVACTSCRMMHLMTALQVKGRVAAVPVGGEVESPKAVPTAREMLEDCLRAHPVSVTIRELDVIRDQVGLRCGECRRVFDMQVSAFESHQKT